MFYDLICSDSAATNNILNPLLESTHENGSKYKELLNFRIAPLPLPYHNHSFQVAQVLPFLDMLCHSGQGCIHQEYATYTLDNLDKVLSRTDIGTE